MKYLIGGCLLFLFTFSTNIFALNITNVGDCDDLPGLAEKVSVDTWPKEYVTVLPQKDAELSYRHLLTFCCKSRIDSFSPGSSGDFSKLCVPKELSSIYPQSPFWFDHLVDVGFRRLDVKGAYRENENDGVDATAKEWRGILFPEDATKVVLPLDLVTKYQFYRKESSLSLFDKQPQPSLSDAIKAYKQEVSLVSRYRDWCYLAASFYTTILGETKATQFGIVPSDDESPYTSCLAVAQYRAAQEFYLAKALTLHYAVQALTTSLKNYTMDTFIQSRLVPLQSLLSSIVDLWGTIAKQAPFCKKCSQ